MAAVTVTDAHRAELAASFAACTERVAKAVSLRGEANGVDSNSNVRLVAVSKTQPWEVLKAVYDAGCRTFGENYVVEIVEKAPQLPLDIDWHFVGHLQSNKVKELLRSVPSLSVIESVDSEKIARKLNDGVALYRRGAAAFPSTEETSAAAADASSAAPLRPLGVMVQVNTSGEETKSGVEPAAATALAKFIVDECPHLVLKGFMTIGMPDYTSRPENFACLAEVRKTTAAALGVAEASLDLSMGMSGDFENAIAMGSTNVRVGTTIFGARRYPIDTSESK